MLQHIKQTLASSFPFLGKYKRFAQATIHHLGNKATYSQHQEDGFILSFLSDFDLNNGIYVDVGANHPTDISNTYLLYKNGLSGLIIEPNRELITLFERFRKRDICLPVGCGKEVKIAKFYISKTPVLSSFEKVEEVFKTVLIPILPLDTILPSLAIEYVYFLSVDVEGLNYEVLEGAIAVLKNTLFLCVEFETEADYQKMETLLASLSFKPVKRFGCNCFFINEPMEKVKRKTK